MKQIFTFIIDSLHSFFFPPFCFDCEGTVSNRNEFCELCSDLISQEMLPPKEELQNRSISTIMSCYSFDNELVRKAVHALKYRSLPYPARELFRDRLPEIELNEYDCIVPIPLHWRRENWRGYNQAMILAKVVAVQCGVPTYNLLKRQRYTVTQTKKKRWERKGAMKAVFVLRQKRCDLQDKKILLIDDVCTTGSTADACAKVLKDAGADMVDLLTLGRA